MISTPGWASSHFLKVSASRSGSRVDGHSLFEIYEDRSIAPAATKTKIIDA
jgi:hypothetical protein